ncbi:MAG: hypothetical protein LBJ10_01540 [Clostridiales bacterium]|jgi:hypothetical protein|nr:hypothetical protein [Clostridiales bacterium]
MPNESKDITSMKLAEIERLINEFKEKFEAGTSDPENFITITEIEKLWGELRNETNNIYSDIVQELMGSVTERELIRKKKLNSEIKE